MDNEAPNYASWIPEAGGYVANGKVVSKSPIYDEAGKLRLDVDTSVFGNTQTPSTAKAQPQVANQATSNVGVTTANVTGSGTDANAQATGIGSLNSLAQNTQNAVDSALSSPAMRSPSAGEPILTIEQQDLKEIQDAHARNDIQGEINGYVKLARDTGVDYTQTINDLTRQRQQKIQGMDDSYLQRISDAKQKVANAKAVADISGKEADKQAYYQALDELNTLQGEQNTWRNAVGYQDAMREMYNQEMEDIAKDYEYTWMKFVNDVGGQLIQMIPALMNFQYDPTQDAALRIAQGYVASSVKEQAISTGTLGSSFMQSAIAKATAELIPVYEKMAREEAIENFKLLQSTANFLMDLEQTQFDMWKSQIQMKWAANDEKRKAIDQAIQNANARGFYTNEEAALLGIAPGTESQAARERALDKQEQIEKELRNLEQSKTLAEFQEKLSVQEYEKKKIIDAKYATNTSTGRTVKVKGYDANGNEIEYTVPWDEYMSGQYQDISPEVAAAIEGLKNEDGTWDRTKVKEYFANDISKMNEGDQADAIDTLCDEYLFSVIDKYSGDFGKDFNKTKNALTSINAAIKDFANWGQEAGIKDDVLAWGTIDMDDGTTVVVDGPIVRAYQRAMGKIGFADDDMDFVWGDFVTDNTKSKGNARTYLADTLSKSGNSALKLAGQRFSNYQKSTAKASTNTANGMFNYAKTKAGELANSDVGRAIASGTQPIVDNGKKAGGFVLSKTNEILNDLNPFK